MEAMAVSQRTLETLVNLPVVGAERRRDLVLRAAFDEVYSRVECFFEPSHTWGGSALTMLVYRVVRESQPQLDAMQVHTLIAAMQRVHGARRTHGGRMPAIATEANEST
jgi:hypothetical protein